MIPIFYFELKMRLKLELILDFSSKVRVLSKCGTQIVSKKKKNLFGTDPSNNIVSCWLDANISRTII